MGMAVGSWRLYLRCATCGETFERVVTETMVIRRPNGTFAPLRCIECNDLAAEPTIRPWALTYDDVRLLRKHGIDAV